MQKSYDLFAHHLTQMLLQVLNYAQEMKVHELVPKYLL